jgi:hypothetical protein
MSHKPDVILIQYTKCEGSKAREIIEHWLNRWSFCSLDVVGW